MSKVNYERIHFSKLKDKKYIDCPNASPDFLTAKLNLTLEEMLEIMREGIIYRFMHTHQDDIETSMTDLIDTAMASFVWTCMRQHRYEELDNFEDELLDKKRYSLQKFLQAKSYFEEKFKEEN